MRAYYEPVASRYLSSEAQMKESPTDIAPQTTEWPVREAIDALLSGHAGQGGIMSVETFTSAGITDGLGFSTAFRAFVNRLWLPRQRKHNGSAPVAVDERPTVAVHSSEGDQSVVATLTARIETLEAEFAKVEAAAAVHRADFERERERCGRLMSEVLKATAETMAAREAAARLAGELAAIRALPWWRRLAG